MLPVILILIVIIIVWKMDLLSSSAKPADDPSLITQYIDTPKEGSVEVLRCAKGVYCNGSPVPDEQSGIGASICGYNNYIYNCVKGIVGPRWQTARTACDADMVGKC